MVQRAWYFRLGIVLALISGIFFAWKTIGGRKAPGTRAQRQSAVPTAEVSQEWLAQAQKLIAQEERQAKLQERDAQGKTLKAPRWHLMNRNSNVRAYLDAEGLEIQPRAAEETDSPWKIQLSLLAAAVDKVEGKEQMILAQRGDLEERLENQDQGLEHTFLLRKGPSGPQTLRLDVALEGLHVTAAGSDRIVFGDFTRDILEYRDLLVKDAKGKKLNAKMEWDGRHIEITLLESGEYPILIDPLITTPAWTKESDQDNAYFGWAVSTAGDVNNDGYSDVIVGIPNYDNGNTNEGRAQVFHGSSTGLPTTAAWTKEGDLDNISFGHSVATAGDVNGDNYSDVIVGAPYYTNGQSTEGRAYVYHGSSTGLISTVAWTKESDSASALFGHSVATAGDVNNDGKSDVIIGAHNYTNGQTNEGKVFVYHGSSTGLVSTVAWTKESDVAVAYFGRSVATAGDINGDGYSDVIVGAYGYTNGQSNEGRAYVYHGSSTGLISTVGWTKEIDTASAYFGYSVATAGDVNGDGYSDVLVGGYNYSNGQSNEGIVHVYHGSSTGLPTTAGWTKESNSASANFGWAVSTAGDVNGDGYADVLIGSYNYASGESGEGQVLLYQGSSTGLSSTAASSFEGNQTYAHLGGAVGPAGDVNGDGYADIIVGAPNYDNGNTDEGRAYVYYGKAELTSSAELWYYEANQADARLGDSVSDAGDVNGDGYSDVIVGAPQYDGTYNNQGRIWVFHGGASGLSASPWTDNGTASSYWLGYSASSAGDTNGDGYSDVIVGALGSSAPQTGVVHLYHGSSTGLPSTPTCILAPPAGGSPYFFGHQVSSAGDINGDGYSDIIVGDYGYTSGEALQNTEGRISVYHGSSTGISCSAPSWNDESDSLAALMGISVSAGDINRDGFSDIITGLRGYNGAQGAAWVYHGSSSGLPSSPTWTFTGDVAYYGADVDIADVNGDGLSDAIVGAYHNYGKVYVYHGNASGFSSNTANWTAESDQTASLFGAQVSHAGDINNDGYSDIIVGAPYYEDDDTEEGAVFIYHGGSSGPSFSHYITAPGDATSAHFGNDTSTAGDINGDGFSDFIVGAWNYTNGQSGEGIAFLWSGAGAPGRPVVPRQKRVTAGTLIQLLGKSDLYSGSQAVSFVERVSPPAGRMRSRLILELDPLSSVFNGAGLERSSWSLPSLGGSDFGLTSSAISAGGSYHWRMRYQFFPFMNFSPWYSIGPNGWNEKDFRAAPSPAP